MRIQIVALIISLCLLVLAWLNYSKTRDLTCNTESSCLSSSFNIAELDSNLKAAYKGRVIDDICFTRLHISSSGELPIEPKDFNGQPIVIDLGNDCRIVEAQLDDSDVRLIRPVIRTDSSKLMIYPTLLNPSDEFSIHLVTTGGEPKISVRARITGVSEIGSRSKMKTAPRTNLAKWLIACIAFSLSTVFFSITAKGVYHGSPVKQSVVFMPKRSFTVWLMALLGTAVAAILIGSYFILTDWFFPVMIAVNLGLMVSMTTLLFNGSRWVVYKEVTDLEEREKLSILYLGPSTEDEARETE